MKFTVLLAAGIATLLSSSAYAGTDMKEVATDKICPSDAGFYASVFGGANVAQDYGNNHGVASASPFFSNASLHVGSGSNIGGVGGLKVGYNFNSYSLGGNFGIQPAVEAEAFYLGTTPRFHYNGSTGIPGGATFSANGQVNGDLDSGAFFINGIARLKTGTIFTPYIGIGVGAEYLSLSGVSGTDTATVSTVRGSTSKTGSGSLSSADDLVFAAQGLAGFDVEFAKHWDFFTEYKFVAGIDPSFNLGNVGTVGGTAVTAKINPDYIGQHLITAGIKYNF